MIPVLFDSFAFIWDNLGQKTDSTLTIKNNPLMTHIFDFSKFNNAMQ